MREAMDRLMAQMQAELLKSAADFGPALRDTMRAQTDQVMADVTEAVRESSTAACELPTPRKRSDQLMRPAPGHARASTAPCRDRSPVLAPVCIPCRASVAADG